MKIKYLFLVIIIFIGFFLRFYRLFSWFYFTMDEERDAYIVKKIIVNHKLTLIGGSVPGGFYLGPYWYYLSSIPMYLGKLHPLSLAFTSSLLAVVSIAIFFLISEKFFGTFIALISSCFYSSSFFLVLYQRRFWPLTLAPYLSLFTYFCLFKIIKERKYKFCYLLSLILILGLNSDPSNIILLFLILIFWLKFRLPLKIKQVRNSLFIFLFSFFPLILFDLRHNFLNLKALTRFLFLAKKLSPPEIKPNFLNVLKLFPQTLSRLIYIFGDRDISRQLALCQKYIQENEKMVPFFLFIISSFLLIYWVFQGFKKTKKDNNYSFVLKLISWQMLLTIGGVSFFNLLYPGHLFEYFLSVLFPAFIFIVALSIDKFLIFTPLKVFATFFLVFINIRAFLTSGNFLGLKEKIMAVDFVIKEVGEKSFSLESLSNCFRYNGIRYLFFLRGKEPEKSFMDSHYQWLYDKPIYDKEPDKKVIFVSLDKNEDFFFWQEYQEFLKHKPKRKKFGGLEVLIINNEENAS